jgi:hypothetical protein
VDLANGLLRNGIEVVTGGELGASRMMTTFEWHNKVKAQWDEQDFRAITVNFCATLSSSTTQFVGN